MRVLGLDSSTRAATVALVDGDHLLGELFFHTGKNHSRSLIPMIDQLLAGADMSLEDIDGFAVAIGPGSFTGLRIGMATIKGLALATAKPVVGVPTLDALAANAAGNPGLIVPVLDARKNEVYAAVYRAEQGENRRLSDYMAIPPDRLVEELKVFVSQTGLTPITFLGDAALVYRELWRASFPAAGRFAEPTQVMPRASQVALLGSKRLAAGDNDALDTLVPFYIRASEAEVKWARAHESECCSDECHQTDAQRRP